jgi:hypothetical protein
MRGLGLLALVCGVTLAFACGGDSDSSSGGNASNNNGGSTDVGGNNVGGNNGGGGATSASGGNINPGECAASMDCPDGEICVNGDCLTGCAADKPCQGGLACCAGACIDTQSNLANCGSCDNACDQPLNIAASCDMGMCQLGLCDPGYFDCDGQASTGCETMSACNCTPGATQPCYPGPAGTDGVGPCQAGTQNCNMAGTAWSLCTGFVVPGPEACGTNVDEDCSGVADDVPDIDNDGWTACDNDCCETVMDCSDPALVNPGAFEELNNMVDDDCDPASSDTVAPPACSTSADFSSVTAFQLTQAMDLCQFTTAMPPLAQAKWGVVNAQLLRPDGTTPPAGQLNNMRNVQTAIMTAYGTGGIVPQQGATMAGISSGYMGDANDPGAPVTSGNQYGYAQNPPAAYLAANGGVLPGSQGCAGACPNGFGANDGVNLRLDIRVPTNALSFSYQFRFISAEYFSYQCSAWNDFYLALLQTGAPGIPLDNNISYDALLNPLSVNNGFFDICDPNGGVGCSSCPAGLGPLSGTIPSMPTAGGGTVWLQTTAPVLPAESMVLELMIFDVSDDWLDSHALLDGFSWSVSASGVGTGPAN